MMRTLIGIAALTAATATFAAPAPAAAPTRSLDFMGQSVDYAAAAQEEGFATPTSKFTLSARFGQGGAMWSSGQHTGLDFAGAVGTPVVAAADGTVASAGPAGAYGNLVEIKHGDGTRTLYAHLSAIDVKAGQKVERGQRVGALGTTGNSSGPHLHFEVRDHGKAVDPQNYLP